MIISPFHLTSYLHTNLSTTTSTDQCDCITNTLHTITTVVQIRRTEVIPSFV